jgi:hypothetical protein
MKSSTIEDKIFSPDDVRFMLNLRLSINNRLSINKTATTSKPVLIQEEVEEDRNNKTVINGSPPSFY